MVDERLTIELAMREECVVAFLVEFFVTAVLLANIALMLLWVLIGPDAQRAALEAAAADLPSGMTMAALAAGETG